MRQNSFGTSVENHAARLQSFRRVSFALAPPAAALGDLRRHVERFPYVPSDPASLDERCMEVYNIQVNALLCPSDGTISRPKMHNGANYSLPTTGSYPQHSSSYAGMSGTWTIGSSPGPPSSRVTARR